MNLSKRLSGLGVAMAVWFAVYVLLDVATTAWLVAHMGLDGESMAPARFLWQQAGVSGLAAAKMAVATPYVAAVWLCYSKVRQRPRLKKAMKAAVMGFTAYAAFIGLNNMFGILAIFSPVPGLLLSPWPTLAAALTTIALVGATGLAWERIDAGDLTAKPSFPNEIKC